MILKLLLALLVLTALVASVSIEMHRHSQGVLDTVKAQQVPKMKSAKTIREYRQ
jgi:hypothetical protein